MSKTLNVAQYERNALAELFMELGPEHPTLCEGWSTRDLLTHLIVRERHPIGALGIFIPALEAQRKRVEEKLSALGFDQLVDLWGSGAPKYTALGLADRWANALEHFVHHEDVRRSVEGWEPRELSAEHEAELMSFLPKIAGMMLRNSEGVVVIEPEHYPRFVAKDQRGVAAQGDAVAVVRGAVQEISLWLYGRDQVEVSVVDPQGFIRRSSL